MEGYKPKVDQEQVERLQQQEYVRMCTFLMDKGIDSSKMSWDEMEDKYRELNEYGENSNIPYSKWHTKGKPKND